MSVESGAVTISRFNEYAGLVVGHIRSGPLRLCVWAFSLPATNELYFGDFIPAAKRVLPPRDSLPEPLDIADHWGNVPNSIEYGGIGALTVAALCRLSTAPAKVRALAIAGGLLLGAAANFVSETTIGQRLIDIDMFGRLPENYVPNQDPVDFALGTLVAAGTAAAITKGPVHHFVPEVLESRRSRLGR